jgi:hypothetical protein
MKEVGAAEQLLGYGNSGRAANPWPIGSRTDLGRRDDVRWRAVQHEKVGVLMS